MNYSLGNMLGGSNGSLNPDKLSLNLQFATDKTLTARKGPTPVFTRASTATFVGSDGLIQSAAVNAARFDHNPTTLASLGLLIEESRTNLLLQSQTFQTTWTATQLNTTGTPAYINVATAPDGTTTANKIIANASSVLHQFRQDVTLVSGTTYSLACYFKAAEQQFASIAVFGVANGNADWVSLFNISSSPSTGTFNGFTSISVTNSGNGWIRCTAIFTASASGALSLRIGGAGASTAGGQFYMGDNSSGILVWGAQLEAGSFPTSYIPTTTASVVRSADLCSISGSNFTGFWNQSAGTLVETFEASPNTNTTYASASNGNIVQNSVHLDNDTGLMRAVYYSGSSLVATLDLGSVGTVGTTNTIATAYSVNDFAASRNGGTVVTDTSGAVPASLSQMNIGTDERSQTPTSFYSNRCIKSLRYYKKRLVNAKLQTLST
jgi:hypothetical protein